MHKDAVMVLPLATYPWSAASMTEISLDNLAPVIEAKVEILLLGCGPKMIRLAPAVRQSLRDHGIVADVMDTGAACRTYNILLAEDRRVAAALLPVG